MLELFIKFYQEVQSSGVARQVYPAVVTGGTGCTIAAHSMNSLVMF